MNRWLDDAVRLMFPPTPRPVQVLGSDEPIAVHESVAARAGRASRKLTSTLLLTAAIILPVATIIVPGLFPELSRLSEFAPVTVVAWLALGGYLGVLESSARGVDARLKREIGAQLRAVFGGAEREWERARLKRASLGGIRIITPPGGAALDLEKKERALAALLPEYTIAIAHSDSRQIVLDAAKGNKEVMASREAMARSGGLIVAIADAEDTPSRPEAAEWTLAPEVGATSAPKIDALAREQGLTLAEWLPYEHRAVVAALDTDTRTTRDRIAGILKCDLWAIEIERTMSDGHTQTVEILRAPSLNLDQEKRIETWRQVTRSIPDGTTGWTVTEDAATGRTTLTWGPTRVLPALVPGADLVPDRIDASAWSKLPLGIDARGNVACLDLKAGPHSLVVGRTGSGKSVSTRIVIVGALARGFEVVYIDPVKRGSGLRDLEPWTRGMYTASVVEAAEVLRAVYAEVTRRVDLIEDARAEDWREVDEIRPWLIVLDEFTGLVRPDAKPPRESAGYDEWETVSTAKAEITTLTSRIAAEARSAGIFLLLSTQQPRTEYIPGDARENLGSVVQLSQPNKSPSRIALGMVFDQDEIDDARTELADLHGANPGFALVSNDGGGLRGIRVGYLEPGEPARLLEALGVPEGELLIPKHSRRRDDSTVEPTLPDYFDDDAAWEEDLDEMPERRGATRSDAEALSVDLSDLEASDLFD
ncbi:hypothetical protein ABE10_12635 [Bacillus toyonensis]|nr:hypothetical protein [Bacillus toyonensis]